MEDRPVSAKKQCPVKEIIANDVEALAGVDAELPHKVPKVDKERCEQIVGSALPYKGPLVLILGDGNLSFSCTLASMYPAFRITATVIENEEEFRARYPSGADILEEITKMPNIELKFCIDATALPEEWSDYNDIIFNFPHPGGKTNLKRSRELMCNVFSSLQRLMTREDCRFHLSLAKRQSGLDHSDVIDQRYVSLDIPSHNKDSWQIIYIAASYGLLVNAVVPFNPADFKQYVSSGYKKRDQKFWNKDAADLISFFKAPQVDVTLPSPMTDSSDEDSLCLPKRFHSFRPFFLHDISIIFGSQVQEDMNHYESVLFRFIRSRTPDLVIDCREVEELRCICPKTKRPNRIYRLYWQSVNKPLHRTDCNKLQNYLRCAISQFFSSEHVPLTLT